MAFKNKTSLRKGAKLYHPYRDTECTILEVQVISNILICVKTEQLSLYTGIGMTVNDPETKEVAMQRYDGRLELFHIEKEEALEIRQTHREGLLRDSIGRSILNVFRALKNGEFDELPF